jgi:YD repeat-containing protein
LPGSAWHKRIGATLQNDVVASAARIVSYAFPSSTVTEVTDDGGRLWRLSRDSQQRLTGIQRPGVASNGSSIAYAGASGGIVSQVVREGVSTNYARAVSGSTGTVTRTDALGGQTVVTSNLLIGRPTAVIDPLARTTSFQYDTNGRVVQSTAPEGDAVQLTYDARGNLTQSRAIAKPGSGLADIVTGASFPAACGNIVTCNLPTSSTDARGNVTDFTYDPAHGGLLRMTAPAASPGAIRPRTRFGYAAVNGVTQLASTSACQTGASCAGTADEVKSALAYDANGNVTAVSSGAGDGTLTATSAMTYDANGDLLSVDGPLPGAADALRYRYNQSRERIGTVSPDPDGAGSLKSPTAPARTTSMPRPCTARAAWATAATG